MPSYDLKTLRGDAQLAEMRFIWNIPLARESVRQAHTLFQIINYILWLVTVLLSILFRSDTVFLFKGFNKVTAVGKSRLLADVV